MMVVMMAARAPCGLCWLCEVVAEGSLCVMSIRACSVWVARFAVLLPVRLFTAAGSSLSSSAAAKNADWVLALEVREETGLKRLGLVREETVMAALRKGQKNRSRFRAAAMLRAGAKGGGKNRLNRRLMAAR